MLTQSEVDTFLTMDKYLVKGGTIKFPEQDNADTYEAKSTDDKYAFLFDVNRKGRKKILKCTYLNRYAITEILLRLDIGGPDHANPDGATIPCPHLHIYKEGYADKWAYQLPPDFTDPGDLAVTLQEFLAYCKINNIPPIIPALF